jgi:hypothetical protein
MYTVQVKGITVQHNGFTFTFDFDFDFDTYD